MAIKESRLDKHLNKKLSEISRQILDRMDEHTRNNLLFIQKSQYEHEIIKHYPSKEWEDLWIKSINDNSKLVAHASCKHCGEYPTRIDISEIMCSDPTIGYRDIKCEKCKLPGATLSIGIEIPVFNLLRPSLTDNLQQQLNK